MTAFRPIHPFSGYQSSFTGVKWSGHDIDHLTSAKVKNEWSCTSSPPVCIHGVDRDNFSLTFVVCGCERFLNLEEKQRLRVFKNRMLMKIHRLRGGSYRRLKAAA